MESLLSINKVYSLVVQEENNIIHVYVTNEFIIPLNVGEKMAYDRGRV